jgi:hypothetical protein
MEAFFCTTQLNNDDDITSHVRGTSSPFNDQLKPLYVVEFDGIVLGLELCAASPSIRL